MKILYLVGPLATGILSYLQGLTRELIDENEITIAYGVWPETPSYPEECFDPRVRLIRVQNFTRELNVKKDVAAFFEIKKIVKAVQPDVIHMHSSKAGALGRMALNGKKYRLFYTPHGYSFLMKDAGAKAKLYKLAEQLCAKRNCTTISCSRSEHEITQMLTKRAICIDNGIDTEAIDAIIHPAGSEISEPLAAPSDSSEPFDSSASSGISHPFMVYTSGRVCTQKNPALFNEIANLIPEATFLWIGTGDGEKLLTAPNIKVTGWVSREEAVKAAASADVFLLPSLWEGLSISLLEAMYLKKLCVVSNIPGNRNVIRNGENGILCKSAEDYAAAIRRTIEDPNWAKVREEKAYRDILSNYSISKMAQRYQTAYQGRYISAYVRNSPEGPACWYRVGQYVPELSEDIPIRLNNAVSRAQYRRNLDLPKGKLRKLYQGWQYLVINANRIRDLNYDLKHHPEAVIIQRELVPIRISGPVLSRLERLSKGTHIFWDFDDDIRLQNECSLSEFTFLEKTAEKIIVTSDYLKNLLSEEAQSKVSFLPTTDGFADGENITSLMEKREETYPQTIRLVWPASFSSLPNMAMIAPVLDVAAEELQKKTGKQLELRVICNRPFEWQTKALKIVNILWTRAAAEQELREAHVGIMPLEEKPYSLGKGGFKLIQYMAAGLPVLSSAVGFNKEIVKTDFGWLLSNDDADGWKSALLELAENKTHWKEMSFAARAAYERNFSYESNLSCWKKILKTSELLKRQKE